MAEILAVLPSRQENPAPGYPQTERRGQAVILQSHAVAPAPCPPSLGLATLAFVALTAGLVAGGCGLTSAVPDETEPAATAAAPTTDDPSAALVAEGQKVFRFETFGDEQLWTATLRLHEVVEKSVDPTTALKVGIKVDADALPAGILDKVDLKSPATTVALLKMNAVVGLQATVDANNHITRLGVTCAFCHSNVDDSVMPGIGRRMDGWPNRDLERRRHHRAVAGARRRQEGGLRVVGSRQVRPALQPGREEHAAGPSARVWPGQVTTKPTLPRGRSRIGTPTSPSPRWADRETSPTHGSGSTSSTRPTWSPPSFRRCAPTSTAWRHPRLRAAASMRSSPSVDARCSTGRARAATLADPARTTTTGILHPPADTGVDGAYAARTATKAYRTTPLRGLWQHAPYFHDGSAATLADVVAHYNRVRTLGLTAEQQRELVEYLEVALIRRAARPSVVDRASCSITFPRSDLEGLQSKTLIRWMTRRKP